MMNHLGFSELRFCLKNRALAFGHIASTGVNEIKQRTFYPLQVFNFVNHIPVLLFGLHLVRIFNHPELQKSN